MTRRGPGWKRVDPLIKETAKGIAGAFFDNQDVFGDSRYQRTDNFRELEKSQKMFVNKHWPEFVKLARSTLGHLLKEPGRSEADKMQIYDALLHDRGVATDMDQFTQSITRRLN